MCIAGGVRGDPPLDLRPHIFQVGQPRFVEGEEDPGLDLPFEEIGAGDDDVIAGLAGEQLGFQRVVGIKHVIADLDAGLAGEVFQYLRIDVIRPVVDVDDPRLPRGGRCQGNERTERCRDHHRERERTLH
jgi:hypothetical protein